MKVPAQSFTVEALPTHNLQPIFAGVALSDGAESIELAYRTHDGNCALDYSKIDLVASEGAQGVYDHIRTKTKEYCQQHGYKFVAVALNNSKYTSELCSMYWRDLDILPFVLEYEVSEDCPVDMVADLLVRKLITYFSPAHLPRVQVSEQEANRVLIDGDVIRMTRLDDYKDTVSPTTWKQTMRLAKTFKERDLSVAFFNATPQGGGVALMRHALLRFFELLEIRSSWHVPTANPSVFRITKNMHNILQGVADDDVDFSEDEIVLYDKWTMCNYSTFKSIIADTKVVVIDDPQMAGLIPLIKAETNAPFVIYRSHIEIRSDLTKIDGTKTKLVWEWLWNKISQADIFLSHPVSGFVPQEVPSEMVGLMPATTDWKDGLNKSLNEWTLHYYYQQIQNTCALAHTAMPRFTEREYIVQVARFDPSKGLPDCIEAYRKLRDRLGMKMQPQLILCGHGSADDPDGDVIYQKLQTQLKESKYEAIAQDVLLIRMPPSDQLLNAVMTGAKVALQLSHREGFEVKISEALHHGKPIVAYKAGGIPLQIQHGVNGYLCEVGDTDAVASYLEALFTDDSLYRNMSKAARGCLSDEVSTVGNALCWLWLSLQTTKSDKLQPRKNWIRDLVDRDDAVSPEKQIRLPREEVEC